MKRFSKHKVGPVILIAALIFIVHGGLSSVDASSAAKNALFIPADDVLNTAKEAKAERFAPKAFEKGMKYYDKAKADDNLDSVEKKLNKAMEYLKEATEIANKGVALFKMATDARNDAMSAEAPRYSTKNWEKAEKKFESAIKSNESGEEKSAKSKAKDAEALYRAGELDSIKTNYLKGAWALLEKAKELKVKKDAPKTLENAQDLTRKAAEMLERDRYDTKEVRKLAQEAKYQANHAIFLAQHIEKVKKDKKDFEDVLLESEDSLQEISKAIGPRAFFDKGTDAPVTEIVAGIKKLQKENAQLAKNVKAGKTDISALAREKSEKDKVIKDKEAKIASLNAKIETMNGELGILRAKEEKLQANVKKQQVRKDKISRIKASLSSSEGNVLQDPDGSIIIRLYGLNFPKGKAVIEPQFFGLLTKVHEAIAEFPKCNVLIEGHTDSTGSDSDNLKLSSERAVAVKEYVIANTNVKRDRVEAVGYGQTKPVASNKTKDGRAKNRRIDVVIKPIN